MKNILILLSCGALFACNHSNHESQNTEKPPVEIADPKYIEISKSALTALCQGNVDGFIQSYSDDADFRWNYGDSLIGRQAIHEYWKERRSSVIDTISFTNEIWLAINANEPPKNVRPGVYVFSWADYAVTYKNGKTINMNIHMVFGFDNADKVNFTYQYLDRLLISNALKPAE
ncbi:MAG TPA: nuclear transport factor 2 family protein [Cyclobacteriaceae bacterium]|nr:nuclear transport factor 2 family protein [Cyclobacteriaceae bacterium]